MTHSVEEAAVDRGEGVRWLGELVEESKPGLSPEWGQWTQQEAFVAQRQSCAIDPQGLDPDLHDPHVQDQTLADCGLDLGGETRCHKRRGARSPLGDRSALGPVHDDAPGGFEREKVEISIPVLQS